MTDQEKINSAEEDINDIFENILLTEERLAEEGYSVSCFHLHQFFVSLKSTI